VSLSLTDYPSCSSAVRHCPPRLIKQIPLCTGVHDTRGLRIARSKHQKKEFCYWPCLGQATGSEQELGSSILAGRVRTARPRPEMLSMKISARRQTSRAGFQEMQQYLWPPLATRRLSWWGKGDRRANLPHLKIPTIILARNIALFVLNIQPLSCPGWHSGALLP